MKLITIVLLAVITTPYGLPAWGQRSLFSGTAGPAHARQNVISLFHQERSATGSPAPGDLSIKVFLIATGDNGKTGRKIGCDDSLVPVIRSIKATNTPLRASIEELLATPREYSETLKNYWFGEGLKVQAVLLRRGVATIRIAGDLAVAGVCDEPRIEAQIRETARQFPIVRRVRVYLNGHTLAEAIR